MVSYGVPLRRTTTQRESGASAQIKVRQHSTKNNNNFLLYKNMKQLYKTNFIFNYVLFIDHYWHCVQHCEQDCTAFSIFCFTFFCLNVI